MAILSKGTTFANGDQVTAAKLNALVDSASFVSGSGGSTDNSTLEVSGGVLAVKDSGITASKIATNAVTTVKILDANVTTAKIADLNVTSGKIADLGVTTAKIADLNVTTGKIADLGVTTGKIADAAVTAAKLAQPLTLGTAQNSTSGTSIDFTSIPSWVKRVTVMLSGVGINANTYLLVQLGDSGGIENTGYLASSVLTSGYDVGNFTTGLAGFPVYDNSHPTTATWTGSLVFTNFGSNQWICSGLVSDSDGNHVVNTAGSKTLSATLDRIRITTNSGTAAFNAGQINIMYE